MRKGREFIFPRREDKFAHAGKSISWPAARPVGDRTSRYAFYNIFPSQFPFAHRRREPKVFRGKGRAGPGKEEKDRSDASSRFHGNRRDFNPATSGKRETANADIIYFVKMFVTMKNEPSFLTR